MDYLVPIKKNLPNKQDEIYQIDVSLINQVTAQNSKVVLSDNSKKVYLGVVRQYNDFLYENGLTVSEDSLRQFFDTIKDDYAGSTLNVKKCALLKLIKLQVGSDSVLRNLVIEKAFAQVDTYKVDKSVERNQCLSEAQIKELINISTDKTGLLIEFLFFTACRVSEAINIKLSHCKINDYVKIRILGKGRKERFVYIARDLYDRINTVYKGQTYLFESKTGKKLNRVNVTKQIKSVGEKLCLEISAHTFRHSRATDLLTNKGYSLKAVSNYLGHSTTAITADMYIHDKIDADDLFKKDSIF